MALKVKTQPAWKTLEMIRGQQVKASEYTVQTLERIRRVEPRIHAYISIFEEEALKTAEKVDLKISRGEKVGRLAGLTVAVKDNICTQGFRTTCASKTLEGFIPPYNATVVERLMNEDAVIVGKTNLDEFAMGSSTEFSAIGPTRNPWSEDRVAGGSSGGSAAAVAVEEAGLAVGSDTGGSVRCPAAFCSVVGLKPTYGLVSRFGLVAYANSLEQIGPIGRSVKDCALLLSAISGHDDRDATSVTVAGKDYVHALADQLKRCRIAVPKEFFAEGTDESVSKIVWRALERLRGAGAICEEISLGSLEYALAAYYIIAMAEASSNLARFDGLRYGLNVSGGYRDWNTFFSKNRLSGFGHEVKRRIILGTYALSAGYYEAYYVKALKVRTLVKQEFERVFKKFDFIAGPTMPVLPFKIGEKVEDPLSMYMCDVDTVPANLTGMPAISVPCGFSSGLPVGIQFIGPPLSEDRLLQAAFLWEGIHTGEE